MTLEERVRRLEDERAIAHVLHTYGHGIDYGLEDEYADCWTEDAVLDWPNHPLYEGREAILGAFRAHTHAPARFHKHVVVDARIEVDGDRAEADSYFMRLDTAEGGPYITAFGRYRDRLVRGEDGRWRLAHRLAEAESHRARRERDTGGSRRAKESGT